MDTTDSYPGSDAAHSRTDGVRVAEDVRDAVHRERFQLEFDRAADADADHVAVQLARAEVAVLNRSI